MLVLKENKRTKEEKKIDIERNVRDNFVENLEQEQKRKEEIYTIHYVFKSTS